MKREDRYEANIRKTINKTYKLYKQRGILGKALSSRDFFGKYMLHFRDFSKKISSIRSILNPK